MTNRQEQSEVATTSLVIDWNRAPRDARWWAMDEDGSAYWYCRPVIAALTPFWFSDQIPAPSFGYVGDWRTSLRERP